MLLSTTPTDGDGKTGGYVQKYSKYSSPLIVVPKKNDNSGEKKFRIAVDYGRLD